MPRDKYPRQSLGALLAKIKEVRVLMVGAGGIGCELLKNLVCTGFGEIHIVDLDTIDLSNLNRQFLFRKEHIKRSKALVAKESAARFNPNVNIVAHHANIKDPDFDVDWYSQFAVVFNALDNLDARRHVNKMCLAANVPLIESGTTGFNGQVQVVKPGQTECYDCNPKETPKTFPVCTIRSTPSQAIHCIVWAKSYLFSEVFGTSEDDAPDVDSTQDADNAAEIESLAKEAQELKRIRESMGSDDFPRKVFDKVYTADIDRLRSMEDMWKSRRRPDALSFDELKHEALGVGEAIASQDQKVWTRAENFAVFCSSLQKLSQRLEEQRANKDVGNAAPVLSFDKDDKDILDFVAASANLRSIVFGIETKSEFDIKQMAGNIIPAIATTNAMTAGLCVMQAFHVLRQELMKPPSEPRDYRKAKMVFLTKPTDRVISSEPLQPPKPSCAVCGVARARIQIDPNRATLKDIVTRLLHERLGYGDELSISSDSGLLFDPDFDDNLGKTLAELGVGKGSSLVVADEGDDDTRVNLVLSLLPQSLPEDQPAMVLPEPFEIARKPNEAAASNGDSNGDSNGVNGEANGHANGLPFGRKRTADEAGLETNIVAKKGKVLEQNGDDVVVVEDDGPITLDDD